jgi:carbon monoxide dehydrogenase subunit G
MKLADTVILPAPPDVVWRALNDPAALEVCLPGCKSLTMLDDRHFESTVQIRVGPVAATFKSNVELSDLDPPKAYTIIGQGNAGAAGFAKLTARVQLAPHADGTELTYDANVEIGGKLMSVGARLIQSAASKNLESFFVGLKAHIESSAASASASASESESDLATDGEASPHAAAAEARRGALSGASEVRSGRSAQAPSTSSPAARAAWPLWFVGVGSGLAGLLVGFFIGHAG